MMILINAFKSITRSKGRNILIGVIILVIAVSSTIALAIQSAAAKAKETGLEAQQITGSISVDREKLMEGAQLEGTSGEQPDMDGMRELMQQYSDLSLEELKKYSDSEYVEGFYYTGSTSLNGSDIEAYSTESATSENADDMGRGNGPGGMESNMGGMSMGDFSVTGYSSEEAMTQFVSGEDKITSGEIFDVESEALDCVISNELAVFNGLSTGDKIKVTNPSNEDEVYTLTVIGIYTSSASTDGNGPRFSTAQDPANQIYMSYSGLEALINKSEAAETTTTDSNGNTVSTALNLQISGTYVFADKVAYDSFETELGENRLSEYYTLTSSDISAYEASLIPLENLSSFASTLLIIILGIGGIILIVLNIFNIRERKYEVGVLTAIGIKKGKVALQFVVELLTITFIAIILGTGIGAIASVPVANNLLESQITAQEATQMTQQENFGRPGGSPQMGGNPEGMGIFGNVDYLNTVNATINIEILGQLIVIGVVLTIISSLAGIIFVLRYEPLKILADRS